MSRFVRLLIVPAVLVGFALGCNRAKDVTPTSFAPPPKTGPGGAGAGGGGVPNKAAPKVD